MLIFRKIFFFILAYLTGVGIYHGIAVFVTAFDSYDGYEMLMPAISGLSIFVFLIAGFLFVEGRVRADAWPGSRRRAFVLSLLVLFSLTLYLVCGSYGNWFPQFLLLLLSVPGYHGMGWISVMCGFISIIVAFIVQHGAGRILLEKQKRLFVVGLSFAILPTALYFGGALSQLWFHLSAREFAANISISEFREIPIIWPGFNGPIGVRLEFEVRHQKWFTGSVSKPWIVMGEIDQETKDKGPDYDIYYPQNGISLAGLGGNRFLQRREKQYPNKFTQKAEVTRFAFDLYPGAVETRAYMANALCLNPRSYGLAPFREEWRRTENSQEPVYSIGNDLSAYWGVRGRGGHFIDLSEMLTKELRAKSIFQNKPEEWDAMHRRLLPADLVEKHGYERYKKRRGGDDEHCYRSSLSSPLLGPLLGWSQ